jgi:integral membrane protein
MTDSIFSSALGRFRLISFLEGLSFIFLLAVAMPLKYIGNMPEATKIPGYIHGFLFIAYLFLLIMAAIEMKWSFLKAFLLFLASIFPFGFLIAEFGFLKKQAKQKSA